MTMTRRVMTSLGCAALTALAVTVEAQGPGPREHGGGRGYGPDEPGRFQRLVRMLDLSEEQVAKLKEQRRQQRKELKPMMEQLHELREQIHKSLEGDAPDALTVGEQTIAAYRLRQQLRAAKKERHQNLLSVLTDEQKERFEELKQRRERRGERRHQRGRHRGGFGGPHGEDFPE